MGRLLLLAVGVAGGALGARRVTRTARSYTPEGLSRRAGGWVEQARAFADDVRAGAAERELELRVALEVDAGSMDAATAAQLLENPTSPRPESPGSPRH